MKIEKAIDNLNFIKHNDFNDNIKQYKRIAVNSIDLAISALEKQMPKKAKGCRILICPCCNNAYIDYLQKHCQDCGQRLDWED